MDTTTVNSIEEALASLGVTETTLSAREKQALDEQGYLLLRGVIDAAWREQLRAAFEALVTGKLEHTAEVFERVYTYPKLLAAAYHVLGRPFRLTGLGGRDPRPGFGQQGLHADTVPRAPGEPFHIVTSLWLLDDFTPENGATRVVPGTHLLTGKVPRAVGDPSASHPRQVLIVAPAGAVLIFNGHLWHSGTRNRSSGSRRVLICKAEPRESARFVGNEPANPQWLAPAVRYLLDV